MQNFDKAVEKYRRELLEFSKNSKVFDYVEEEVAEPLIAEVEQIEEKAVPAMAEVVDTYEKFLEENSSQGQLKIQVTIAGTIPLPNANVTVTLTLADGEKELYNGFTNVDGIVDPIVLPAPPVTLSYDENGTTVPYATYTVKVTHPNYSPAEFRNVPVFDSIKSIQPVILVPITENGNIPGTTLIKDQPMNLYGGEN